MQSIFHGDNMQCPLWWLMIPAGCTYHKPPDRAQLT